MLAYLIYPSYFYRRNKNMHRYMNNKNIPMSLKSQDMMPVVKAHILPPPVNII